jgi:hypothetical protein
MSLNPTVLAAAIQTQLIADMGTAISPGPMLTAFCTAIATAIVTHLTSAGVVAVVTTCPAGAGTGTGTIT